MAKGPSQITLDFGFPEEAAVPAGPESPHTPEIAGNVPAPPEGEDAALSHSPGKETTAVNLQPEAVNEITDGLEPGQTIEAGQDVSGDEFFVPLESNTTEATETVSGKEWFVPVENPVESDPTKTTEAMSGNDLFVPVENMVELNTNEATEAGTTDDLFDLTDDPAALNSTEEPQPLAADHIIGSVPAPDTIPSGVNDPAVPPKRHPSGRGRRSLRDVALPGEMPEIPDDEVLFSRQYYSMREVSAMFRENQSLIRYWETEFDILQPKKNGKGDRFFRPVDVKNLLMIYDLLRRRKFTIEGAKEYLKNNRMAEAKFEMIQSLGRIRAFLLELKAGL